MVRELCALDRGSACDGGDCEVPFWCGECVRLQCACIVVSRALISVASTWQDLLILGCVHFV